MTNSNIATEDDSPSFRNTIVILLADIKRDWKKYSLKAFILGAGFFISLVVKDPKNYSFQWDHLYIIVGGALIISILTFFVDNYFDKSYIGKILVHRFAFEITSTAISHIKDSLFHTNHRPQNYLKNSLICIQRITGMILKEYSIKDGYISVNFMRKDGNLLVTEEWDGAQTPEHIDRELPIDVDNPLPGAPQAVVDHQIHYIDNTESKRYKKYFNNPRYKSFFSYPVLDSYGNVIGVINVDSDKKDQFLKSNFIKNTIKPAIEPIVTLLELENCIKTNNR